jgi:UDP-N-acetyl-D-glucosamine dehydrogenase
MNSKKNQESVAIIGLGYVGLPLALLFYRKGFHVIGIDTDARKIASLQASKSYINDVSDEQVNAAMRSTEFEVTNSFVYAARVNVMIICVPTPLTEQHTPDLSFLETALSAVKPYLHKGQLLILESSTYPGTTEELLIPSVESAGFTPGLDIFVAYSPERVDPGRDMPLETIPKVVSGHTPACRTRIEQLYSRAFQTVVPVSSTRTAEMVKIIENTHRFINIALVNQLALVCRAMDINIWEAIQAAATKPYGFTPYYPGPGIGGHCIPVDPLYLQWKAEQAGLDVSFINLANLTNLNMPKVIIEILADALDGKPIRESKVLILGVTYKKDISDTRESPALLILKELLNLGASITYHDRFAPRLVLEDRELLSVGVADIDYPEYDCVLILTDHSGIDYQQVVEKARLVLDTRNVTQGIGHRPNVIVW